jgi:hypothetical protein
MVRGIEDHADGRPQVSERRFALGSVVCGSGSVAVTQVPPPAGLSTRS